MDFISIIASIFLVLFCLYMVLSPLTQKSSVLVTETKSIMIDDAIYKAELYATLNEIEMDYKMNKLSDEDYKSLKMSYEKMAAEILQKESTTSKKDKIKLNNELLQQIEIEIQADLEAVRQERRAKS